MKYFKNPENGEVFAYESDGSQDAFIAANLLAMSDEEVANHLAPSPVDYAALIASRRYTAETSGIVVGGVEVDTGRDSQALITGAALNAVIDPSYICNWKTPAGFVQLDAQTLLGVATTLRAHVQSCFDREAELLAALNAGEFIDEMLEEGWPDESVSTTPAG